jgi:hypothetical protein
MIACRPVIPYLANTSPTRRLYGELITDARSVCGSNPYARIVGPVVSVLPVMQRLVGSSPQCRRHATALHLNSTRVVLEPQDAIKGYPFFRCAALGRYPAHRFSITRLPVLYPRLSAFCRAISYPTVTARRQLVLTSGTHRGAALERYIFAPLICSRSGSACDQASRKWR